MEGGGLVKLKQKPIPTPEIGVPRRPTAVNPSTFVDVAAQTGAAIFRAETRTQAGAPFGPVSIASVDQGVQSIKNKPLEDDNQTLSAALAAPSHLAVFR